MSYEAFPGGDLIEKGLADLAASRETVESLLVSIGAPRLRLAGIPVRPDKPVDHPSVQAWRGQYRCLSFDPIGYAWPFLPGTLGSVKLPGIEPGINV